MPMSRIKDIYMVTSKNPLCVDWRMNFPIIEEDETPHNQRFTQVSADEENRKIHRQDSRMGFLEVTTTKGL